MALIKCSECKGKVSDKALMCPHCGFGMQKNLENILLTQKNKTAHQGILDKANVPLAQDEKREHKRINIKMMTKINQETARLCNISKSGMKLATPIVHRSPSIEITLDNGEKIFKIKAIIRWVSSKRSFSNLIDIGVEISEAPPEYYEFIDQLLATK
jgi:hypothetical protein